MDGVVDEVTSLTFLSTAKKISLVTSSPTSCWRAAAARRLLLEEKLDTNRWEELTLGAATSKLDRKQTTAHLFSNANEHNSSPT
jgi:hypothetical protein